MSCWLNCISRLFSFFPLGRTPPLHPMTKWAEKHTKRAVVFWWPSAYVHRKRSWFGGPINHSGAHHTVQAPPPLHKWPAGLAAAILPVPMLPLPETPPHHARGVSVPHGREGDRAGMPLVPTPPLNSHPWSSGQARGGKLLCLPLCFPPVAPVAPIAPQRCAIYPVAREPLAFPVGRQPATLPPAPVPPTDSAYTGGGGEGAINIPWEGPKKVGCPTTSRCHRLAWRTQWAKGARAVALPTSAAKPVGAADDATIGHQHL